jgi:hypothetical protein
MAAFLCEDDDREPSVIYDTRNGLTTEWVSGLLFAPRGMNCSEGRRFGLLIRPGHRWTVEGAEAQQVDNFQQGAVTVRCMRCGSDARDTWQDDRLIQRWVVAPEDPTAEIEIYGPLVAKLTRKPYNPVL